MCVVCLSVCVCSFARLSVSLSAGRHVLTLPLFLRPSAGIYFRPNIWCLLILFILGTKKNNDVSILAPRKHTKILSTAILAGWMSQVSVDGRVLTKLQFSAASFFWDGYRSSSNRRCRKCSWWVRRKLQVFETSTLEVAKDAFASVRNEYTGGCTRMS